MPVAAVREIRIWYERAGTGPQLRAILSTGGDLRREPDFFTRR
jgi:hypothetical protein